MIGAGPRMKGPGCNNMAPPALEVSQAEASPLTTQVGPELREDSEPETCGRVCAAAGSAAVKKVPAVSMPMIKVRMGFSPFHSGSEGSLATPRMHEMNAPPVPLRLELTHELPRFVGFAVL